LLLSFIAVLGNPLADERQLTGRHHIQLPLETLPRELLHYVFWLQSAHMLLRGRISDKRIFF
jgi:hypothetical protein